MASGNINIPIQTIRLQGTSTATGTVATPMDWLVSNTKILSIIPNNSDRIYAVLRTDSNHYYIGLYDWGGTTLLTNKEYDLLVVITRD